MQPNKYSKKNFKTELQEKLKTTSKVLDKPAVISYEELGGLSDKARLISYLPYLSRMNRR
jgi:hypothetical protein